MNKCAAWSINRSKMARENRNIWTETCRSATSSTKNPTRIGLRLNLALHRERQHLVVLQVVANTSREHAASILGSE
jgi:hypothetical protein